MKNIITISLIAVLAITGCKKEEKSNAPTISENQVLTPSPDGLTDSTCDGVATWNAQMAYSSAGILVVHNGVQYRSNRSTAGESPETNNGVNKAWSMVTSCGVAPVPTPIDEPSDINNTAPVTTSPDVGLPTPVEYTVQSSASGEVHYHLNLPYGSGNVETLTLAPKYTDLIISNYVAGVLLGHMIHKKDSKLKFNKDYIYGSLFGQLLQENIDTAGYINTSDWINANDAQRASLLASGQGGPYQINDYSKRLENETGVGLVNFVALQKGLGYTVEKQDSGDQTASKGPDSLDQKYFGPLAAAYFHFNDINRLEMNNKETYGPQYEYYGQCMSNLRLDSSADNEHNIFDLILNAAYNAGTYSAIIKDYFRICAGMYTNTTEKTQLKSIGDYTLDDAAYKNAIASTESVGTTFILYPRQIRIYLDQMHNQKTFSSAAISGTNSIKLSVQDIRYVFQNTMGTLAYVNSDNKYDYIGQLDSKQAFTAAMSSNAVTADTVLNISTASGKNTFFKLLEDAISNLATTHSIDFTKVTQTTIGGSISSGGGSVTPEPTQTCPSNPVVYPAGLGMYQSGTVVKASDAKLYQCLSGVAAWCNSEAQWAYAPATGTAWSSAWSVLDCK